jgi:hypothetical protein
MMVLATLWMLSILSLFCVSTARETGLDIHLARYANRAVARDAVLDAWIARASFVLLSDPDWSVDTPRDPWLDDDLLAGGPDPAVSCLIVPAMGPAARASAGAIPAAGDPMTIPDGWVRGAGLMDENAKLPLAWCEATSGTGGEPGNAPKPREVLRRLGAAALLGALERRSESRPAADLRTADTMSLGRILAADREIMNGGGIGGDGDLVPLCFASLSARNGGTVNINTAPEPVLAALGLEDPLIRKIVSCRSQDEGFGSADTIVEDLSQYAALAPAEISALQRLQRAGGLSVQSTHFSFVAEIRLDGDRHCEYRHVVLRRSAPDVIQVISAETLDARLLGAAR